jgi:hypothetical protein
MDQGFLALVDSISIWHAGAFIIAVKKNRLILQYLYE